MASPDSPPPSSAGTDHTPILVTRHATLESLAPLESAAVESVPPEVGKLWMFRMRPDEDGEEGGWWFASTAIPLLAATLGPLANVMSIAALITSWRNNYDTAYPGQDSYSVGFRDPHWCIGLNAASLACGFAGNIFLLFNFTRRIRYIVALPMTILLWYISTGIVSKYPSFVTFVYHPLYSKASGGINAVASSDLMAVHPLRRLSAFFLEENTHNC